MPCYVKRRAPSSARSGGVRGSPSRPGVRACGRRGTILPASAVVQPRRRRGRRRASMGVDSVVRERVAAGQEPLGAARVRAEPRREEPARQHAGADAAAERAGAQPVAERRATTPPPRDLVGQRAATRRRQSPSCGRRSSRPPPRRRRARLALRKPATWRTQSSGSATVWSGRRDRAARVVACRDVGLGAVVEQGGDESPRGPHRASTPLRPSRRRRTRTASPAAQARGAKVVGGGGGGRRGCFVFLFEAVGRLIGGRNALLGFKLFSLLVSLADECVQGLDRRRGAAAPRGCKPVKVVSLIALYLHGNPALAASCDETRAEGTHA